MISSYDYTPGPTGIRNRIIENDGTSVDTLDYDYDEVYRLLEEQRSGAHAYEIGYEYDAVGNRLKKFFDSDTTIYEYDERDQLLNEVLNNDTTFYDYDNNGNTIKKDDGSQITDYSYDAENRLLKAKQNGSLLSEYLYDPDGNKIKLVTPADTTHFLIDPNQPLPQVIAEHNNAGTLIVAYLHGDDLISQSRNGVKNYYHYDGLGSTRLLTDASALITNRYTYYAFGEILYALTPVPNAYMFTGEQFDPNLGFYYLRARLYNPALGRFLTTDLFQGSIYDPPSLHKYLYCNGDPINRVDRNGLFSLIGSLQSMVIQSMLFHIAWMAVSPAATYLVSRLIPEELFARELSAVRFGITGSVVAGQSWYGGGFTTGIDILVFPAIEEVAFYGYLGATFGNPGALVAAEGGGAFGLFNDSRRWSAGFLSLNYYHRLPPKLLNLPQKVNPHIEQSKALLSKVAETQLSDTPLGLIMKAAAHAIQSIHIPTSLSMGASFTISLKEYEGVKPCAFSVGTGGLSAGRSWGFTFGYTWGLYSNKRGWWFTP